MQWRMYGGVEGYSVGKLRMEMTFRDLIRRGNYAKTREWFSQTNSITWEFVRNADSQGP